jgi:hypothetical protein
LDDEEYKNALDEHERGKWKGWGYFYSLANDLFHSARVYYVTVDDKIEVRSNPELDP